MLRQHIEKVVELRNSDFETIAVKFKQRKIRKNQYLLQEGNICNNDNFVVEGALRQYYVHDNKEMIIQFAFENWWISDWASMLNDTPTRFNIDALENSEVLQIDKSSIYSLFNQVPAFERFYRTIFQRAFVAQQKRIASMQKSAEESYAEFVAMYGHFEQRVSQGNIASYLGITRESLSRLKNQSLTKIRKEPTM